MERLGAYSASVTERWQADEVEGRERARVTAPELSWSLRELTRVSAEVDHALAQRLRLRALEYDALGHLMDEPGALGPVELSSRLGISTGSGTELVDRLERAGHVQRHRHPRDRRRLTLQPTDSAVGQVLEQLAPLFADLDLLAAELSEHEQALVTRYLREAAQRMRRFAQRRLEPDQS
jgi:DNA-binding MarR family transcriptional regulator